MNKVIYTLYTGLLSATLLIYLDLKEFEIGFLQIINIIIISLYSGFGLFAGWELLTFSFEQKMSKPMVILYFIPKAYLSMYVGIVYLPFWLFKRLG